MDIFIVFVMFLDWIIDIWVKLARLIGEKRGSKVLEGGPNYKNKIYNNYIYIGPRGGLGPLGSLPGPVLVLKLLFPT